MPAPLVAQVSDHFNVMHLIDDEQDDSDPDTPAPQPLSGLSDLVVGGARGRAATSSDWHLSASLGSAGSSASGLDNGSPLDGFGSTFSADDLARTPRSAERLKSRRWTVNVPSVAHLQNPFGLQLPSLAESEGPDASATELDEIHREEARLQAQLEAVRQRKQQVVGGEPDSAGQRHTQLPPGPPPSPPPSPPLHPRRFSALDIGTMRAGPANWQTPPESSSSPPSASMLRGMTLSENERAVQPEQQRVPFGARSRRHTVVGMSPEPRRHGAFFATDSEPEEEELLLDANAAPRRPMEVAHSKPSEDMHAPREIPGGEYLQYLQQLQQQYLQGPPQHMYPPPPPPPPPPAFFAGGPGGGYYMHAPPPHAPPMYMNPHAYLPGMPPPHPHALAYAQQQQQQQHAAARGAGGSAGAAQKQATGPPGANIFVFNFPRGFEDADLRALFMPFGPIVSATVFIDKATGKSKCFGFVSFEHAHSAQAAIAHMHGAVIGGKAVKVQIKRERAPRSSHTNPQDQAYGEATAQVGEM